MTTRQGDPYVNARSIYLRLSVRGRHGPPAPLPERTRWQRLLASKTLAYAQFLSVIIAGLLTGLAISWRDWQPAVAALALAGFGTWPPHAGTRCLPDRKATR